MRRAVVVLSLALAACSRRAPSTEPARADAGAPVPRVVEIDPALVDAGRVRVQPVAVRPPRAELRVPGEVRARAAGAAEVGALVSGRVASVLVEEGARVKRGDVLAWIDAPEVARATADLVRARARADLASKKLARQLVLEQQTATSKTAVDEARAEEQAARADLAASRTLLASLGGVEPSPAAADAAIPARVPIRAPIDGIVTAREAVLGAPVAPDKTLFRIVGSGGVSVVARVPETAAPPPIGAPATLAARTPDAPTCAATVRGGAGVVDAATRTVAVRVEPSDACAWLSHGGYVDVLFSPSSTAPAAIVVPKDAVVDVHGVPSVFVAQPKRGAFVLRTVRVKTTAGPDAVVEDGLTPGEGVVVDGAVLLKGDLLRSELEGS